MLYTIKRILGSSTSVIATGTSAAMSTGVDTGVRAVMINANTAVFIAIDTTPVATSAGGIFVPANETNFFNINPGQKVAAVCAATNGLVTSTVGTVYVTPVE